MVLRLAAITFSVNRVAVRVLLFGLKYLMAFYHGMSLCYCDSLTFKILMKFICLAAVFGNLVFKRIIPKKFQTCRVN